MQRAILSLLTLCALMLFINPPRATAQNVRTKPSLVGSWEFTVEPDSGHSAEHEIAGLATFTSDGTVIETDTSQAAFHVTSGHGIWQPGPAIGTLFVRFTNLAATPEGKLHTKRIVTLTVELNSTGDRFNGGYSFEVIDTSGRTIETGSGSITGELMVHPLLP